MTEDVTEELTDNSERLSMKIKSRLAPGESEKRAALGGYFMSSLGSVADRLANFPKFVPRPELTTFLARYEIFKQVLHVPGAIIECGVYLGGGLMTWAQLSSVLEPYGHYRRVFGFDTFTGFAGVGPEDAAQVNLDQARDGGLASNAEIDIRRAIEIFDSNRPLNHIKRVELVVGDARDQIPLFVERNPHLVVGLLYLDFDIYEPTLIALKHLLPRMPKGAVLAFDELNDESYPGETIAVNEHVGLGNLRIQKFSFEPRISYAIIE